MNMPYRFDCAYMYTSSSNEVKFGLFEVDILNQFVLSHSDNGIRIRVFPLLETAQPFETCSSENIKILKRLKSLQLDLRTLSTCYIEEFQLKSLVPILLIHIKNFVDGRILFREGMDKIYGIEKAITDDTVQTIDFSEFPVLRVNQEDSNSKICSLSSKHNLLYEEFGFRVSLVEAFQQALLSNRGKTSEGRFKLTNVSLRHAESFFSFINKSLQASHHECKYAHKESSVVKDILFQKDSMRSQQLFLSDTLYSMTQKTLAADNITVTVPYPSLLFGYLSNHYFKYPINVTQQRSGLGYLDEALWDHIPFSGGVTVYSYNMTSLILTVDFPITQTLNTKIPKDFIPEDRVDKYKKTLNNVSFRDDVFGWRVTVKMIEYNVDTFPSSKNSQTKSPHFVAWAIQDEVFSTIPSLERTAFLDRCNTDTELRNTYFVPYDPDDLDPSTNTISFRCEDSKNTHIKVVKWWFHNRVCTIEETRANSSSKKQKWTIDSKSKDSKKSKISIKFEAVTPVSSNKGANDRTLRKCKGESDFKQNLEGFLTAINVFIINVSNEDDMRGYARYVYTSMDITNTEFLHQDIIQQKFQNMIEAYYYSLPKWKEIFSLLLTDFLTNQNELAEITTKLSLAIFLTKVVTDTIW